MTKIFLIIAILFQLVYADMTKEEAQKKVDALFSDISNLKTYKSYQKNFKRFASVSEKVLKHDPTNFKAHAFLGYYYMDIKENYQLALEHFKKASLYDQSNPNYYYMIGIIYGIEKKYELAKKYFNKAIDLDPNTQSYGYLFSAKADELEGKKEEAIDNYNRAIESDIKDNIKKMAYYLKGEVYLDNEQSQEAIEVFNQMLNLYPKDRNALNALALSYETDMQYENSKDIYAKLIQYYPNDYIGYLGYFETQLILGENWDEDKVKFYTRNFSNNTLRIAQFELLKVLRSAIYNQDYKNELQRWQNYYGNLNILKHWSLSQILNWTYTIDDSAKRMRLLEVLANFKDKKFLDR